MEVFLIYDKANNQYKEVLKISCVIEANNRKGSYKFEKKMVNDETFKPFTLKNSYVLNSLEDIERIEVMYKRKLRNWAEEQKEHKKVNHRAQIANYILKVNGREVFNLKNEFGKLWEVTDEQIRERIEQIQFEIARDGNVYAGNVGAGYLI